MFPIVEMKPYPNHFLQIVFPNDWQDQKRFATLEPNIVKRIHGIVQSQGKLHIFT